MKCTTVSTTTITDVDVGDIFQCVEEVGCYRKGALLVVQEQRGVDITFVPPRGSTRASGDLHWLAGRVSSGHIVYVGTVAENNLGAK